MEDPIRHIKKNLFKNFPHTQIFDKMLLQTSRGTLPGSLWIKNFHQKANFVKWHQHQQKCFSRVKESKMVSYSK